MFFNLNWQNYYCANSRRPDYGQGETRSPLFYLLEPAHIQNLFVPNDSKYPAITRFLFGTFHVNFISTLNAVGWTKLILQAGAFKWCLFYPYWYWRLYAIKQWFYCSFKRRRTIIHWSTAYARSIVSWGETARAPQSCQVNKKKKREGLNKKCLN